MSTASKSVGGRGRRSWMWLLQFLILAASQSHLAQASAQFAWTNIQTSVTRGQVDLWTATASGCTCPYDVLDHSCACCVLNGCHCGQVNPQRCGQCGLEQHCDNMCNVTISAREILSRSGQTFGEIKSPSSMSGPSFCWYKLKPEQNQRVEVQIYRIKRLGRLNTDTKRCVGGFLQLVPDSPNLSYDPSEVSICGANERYSPPIVLFGDSGSNSALLFKIEESTSLSQFLAHYSFTPIDKEDTGFQIKGGIKVMPSGENDNSGCDWRFEERHCQTEQSKGGCQLATPGFPGIYPPNKRCRYLIEANSKNTQIKLTFRNINLPPEECEAHKVTVYKGPTSSSPILKSFCGFAQKQKVTSNDVEQIMVEFSSGSVLSPFNYNGFVAKIEFVPRENNNNNNRNGGSSSTSGSSSGSNSNSRSPKKEEPKSMDDDEDDDEEDGEEEEEYESEETSQKEESGRKSKPSNRNRKVITTSTSGSGSSSSSSDSAKCQIEYEASESRTGIIRSTDLNLVSKKCNILFKGNPGDVVRVKLSSYKLRGRSCESSITLSARRRNQREPTQSDVFEHVCSPATRRNTDQNGRFVGRPPILINSSFVSLEYQAHRINVDRFVAVYQFHHVLSEGLPIPNTTCDSLYPGRTGSSKGTLESPDPEKSEIFRNWEGPLKCVKSLVPTDSQSLTLKITSSSHKSVDGALAEDHCETFCDERGCRCLIDSNISLDSIDHLIVTPLSGGGRVACFCGEFSHLLPLNVISSSGLAVVYNSANFKSGGTFSYVASYNFHNEETCGPRRVSSPLGSLESPLAASPPQSYHPSSTYFHQQCQWFFDPPTSKQLILKISTAEKMDCLTWNATIAIWNTSVPDQIGTVIDRFCPEISAKEYILNTTERKIVISLHSMAPGPIHFRISWETRGLMPRDEIASNVDTKEVIDGAGGFFGTSRATTIKNVAAFHLVAVTLSLISLV